MINKDLQVIGICGSLRKQSYNKKLIEMASILLPEGTTFTLADYSKLPLFNEDIEDPFPIEATRFKRIVESADVLLISTPMYNSSISGVLKNAIDWLTRPMGSNSLNGKVAAIMGATPGFSGTVNAQAHLREILTALNVIVVPQPMVYISEVNTKIDIEGSLVLDSIEQEPLQKLINRVIELTNALRTEY